MMDYNPIIDLVSVYSQVHTFITGYNLISNLLPLSRSVKALIHIAIEAES